MAFLLVFVEDGFYFFIQSLVCFLELYGNILMNCAFADPELTGGSAHRSVILNNEFPKYNTSFLTAVIALLQRISPLTVLFPTINIMLTNSGL